VNTVVLVKSIICSLSALILQSQNQAGLPFDFYQSIVGYLNPAPFFLFHLRLGLLSSQRLSGEPFAVW
jgi:hypothetical protein